ncbi:MAG: proton-conducting transporter membrane subunit [Bacteroidales bacterium]|jgi:formate hydrogenlyase subunit 3/multisubunit Na+/H+ antiporter MnhD subunit|nr:proton-conducting transporter membrane subunit [Bacteroidales bacterium]
MILIYAILIVVLLSVLIIPILESRQKGIITLISVIGVSIMSSIPAIKALTGEPLEIFLSGTLVTSVIPIRIDALSAWFILTINFTFITGIIYGMSYMQAYKKQKSNLSLHWISYILAHTALVTICSVQNSLVFLIAWEIMALSAFFLVIFESYSAKTLKAGINYLIQSHISILFITLGFIWVFYKTNSFDFALITEFANSTTAFGGLILMVCFFIGFAIKAGFVPFHTWLPLAHPAAPAHISGIMSGVIIKIGIYGILRMVFLIKTDYLAIGYFILLISIISGVYGVMMAILQHNLKRLLAYHSIENIGIIGIGIGLGCIGLGTGNNLLSVLGFSGALLHTLNHSLFKSLLFYGAGNIYQSVHTVNIEQLGGLGKNMAQTAFLFLIASLAICGLPPFNGFVSEFIIYSGIFNGIHNATFLTLMFLIFSLFGLVLIGGLAILCFTKAFGTIFLGSPRHVFHHQPQESSIVKRIPMYLIVMLIITIGIFPTAFLKALSLPVSQLTGIVTTDFITLETSISKTISQIGYVSLLFIGVVGIVFYIRRKFTVLNTFRKSTTWGCSYTGDTSKMQYTASSFVRNYRKLAEPLFSVHKFKRDIKGIFPGKAWHETHPKDKIEEMFISYPIRQFKHFLNFFSILQSGKSQMYILYGAVFITLLIAVPQIYNLIITLVNFLNNL